MRILRFFVFMLVVLIMTAFVLLTYTPESHGWNVFMDYASWAKYILMPIFIVSLPYLVSRTTKTKLTPQAKRMVIQCQVIIGALFLLMEAAIYLGGE